MARPHKRGGAGWLTWLALLAAIVAFGTVLYLNRVPESPGYAGVPTQQATERANPVPALLQGNFGQNSTPLPTIGIPIAMPTVAQLAPLEVTLSPVPADALGGAPQTNLAQAVTPTLALATTSGDDIAITAIASTRSPEDFQPPPLIPPLSRDPLGRDHYWLMRPIDSNARNWVLSIYPFGSDGSDPLNPLRVHHGVDMPNPVGEIVRAAGSGTVIWSADGRQAETDIFQNSPSYGNVVMIEHDFGYRGQLLWTLYAHLSASFVQVGQQVVAGEAIGQVGNTGRVTGPHVHFEVRMGASADDNRYANTFNPVLWMVPYVGHGVIAGRVVDSFGNEVQDAEVTIRNRTTGLVETTTTTYVILENGFDVNSDPAWGENFAVPDIPTGRYDVIATIDGVRVVRQVDVFEGTTTFVDLKPAEQVDTATPTPAATDAGGG